MNNPPNHLLSAAADACSTTLGRCLAFCVAGLLPWFVMGAFRYIDIAALPVYVVGSMATGWGLLIYPALAVCCFLYVRSELTHWWLVVPPIVCALDFWRVTAAFSGH